MKSGEVYTQNQIDKLGNALIFLCEKMDHVSKTHLLKLIFIIEEISVKKFGIPFFNLRFDVWKLGPVSKDLFVELSNEPELLSEYIRKNEKGEFSSQKPFSDDEFTDQEITLLEQITDRFLYCTATELINFTHRSDSPWYKAAQKNGVLELLEEGKMTTTNIEIDLSEMIEDEPDKLAIYRSYKNYLEQSKSLKL
jgi:uncharacterized phage-associated protein